MCIRDRVNAVADSLSGVSQVYAMAIPLSSGITLPDELFSDIPGSDQAQAEKDILAGLGQNVKTIPLHDVMMSHRTEYIYFRTCLLYTSKGLDGCRMRNGFHFEYKGLHMTYHKTLPYSTIVEKGDDGVTYDILYDILIKQNGEIHSDWTGVKMDVDAYRKVVFEPYDLKVLNGTIDF